MSAITINFTDAEALKEATVQALSGALSPEIKAELIRKSIEALLTTPPKTSGYYGTPKAPIQEMFEQAIFTFTREIALDMVKTDAELRGKLEAAMRDAAAKCMTDHSRFADALSTAFEQVLRKDAQ